jgi:hypothetical protein
MKPTILVAIAAAAVSYSADAKKDKDVVVVTADGERDEVTDFPTYSPTMVPTGEDPEVSSFFPCIKNAVLKQVYSIAPHLSYKLMLHTY